MEEDLHQDELGREQGLPECKPVGQQDGIGHGGRLGGGAVGALMNALLPRMDECPADACVHIPPLEHRKIPPCSVAQERPRRRDGPGKRQDRDRGVTVRLLDSLVCLMLISCSGAARSCTRGRWISRRHTLWPCPSRPSRLGG